MEKLGKISKGIKRYRACMHQDLINDIIMNS